MKSGLSGDRFCYDSIATFKPLRNCFQTISVPCVLRNPGAKRESNYPGVFGIMIFAEKRNGGTQGGEMNKSQILNFEGAKKRGAKASRPRNFTSKDFDGGAGQVDLGEILFCGTEKIDEEVAAFGMDCPGREVIVS